MLLGITSPLVEDRAQQTLRVQTPQMDASEHGWWSPLSPPVPDQHKRGMSRPRGRYVDPREVTT
jgi:hypothetical protein